MRITGLAGLAVVALTIAAGPCLAADKIFHLKNGRTIQGELIQENPDSYVVKGAGGEMKLSKDMVKSVEDAPSPDDVLKPEEKKPAKTDKPTAPDSTSTPKDTGSTPKVDGTPLAGADDVSDAKTKLRLVPKIDPRDPDRSAAARQKAIDDVVKTVKLPVLVAIIAEPQNKEHPTPPAENSLAQEIVQRFVKPVEKVRPVLAQAVANIDLEKGTPQLLFGTVRSLGDTDNGLIANALVDKARESMGRGLEPDPVLAPIDMIGTRATLEPLYKVLLESPDKSKGGIAAIGKICRALVFADRDPDAAVAPITLMIKPEKLPPFVRLYQAISVVTDAKRTACYPFLSRTLDSLERLHPKEADLADYKACLGKVDAGLVMIWTDEARNLLVRTVEEARTPERRIQVLGAIAKVQANELPIAMIKSLFDNMKKTERTDKEVEAFGSALAALTRQHYGSDIALWEEYIKALVKQH